MDVILLEDVKTLGKKGQIVKINDGYARNYVLPKKLGIEATAKNLNDLKLAKKREEKEAAEMVGLYREYYQEKGIFDNWVYEGVMEMLKTLKEAGLTIVMATSKPEKFAKMIAEHFGFAKYFDLIGGACMNGARTKKQEVIQYVLGQCEEKDLEKIRMVGDRCYDIEGANREGIRAIGVLYGYGSKEELEEAGADGLAETPEEVVRMILNGMHP